jgi:ATP-dependent Clp protease adaptor protein ClpS
MSTITEIEEETLVDTLVEELVEPNKAIVVYNDDVNDFLHVINCFMMYCDHAKEQAEQCALIIHHNGKCAVKGGSYDKLKPICEALLDQKLSAKIE